MVRNVIQDRVVTLAVLGEILFGIIDNMIGAEGEDQLHSLVMLAYHTQGLGMSVGFVLLGLGSAVFAYLLLRSRYVPKAFAVLGIFSSLLLAIGTLVIIAFPGLGVIGMSYMMPMGLYEVGLGFWLLIKGIKAQTAQQA